MYGLALYGQCSFSDDELTLWGPASDEHMSTPAAEFASGMTPGVHEAGAAVLTSAGCTESACPTPPRTTSRSANLVGVIKPYLYDQLFYDERVFEAPGSDYSIESSDYGVHRVYCSSPPMVPDMLSGGFDFPADTTGSLHGVCGDFKQAMAYFLDALEAAVFVAAKWEGDRDNSIHCNDTLSALAEYDAVECYTYVPPHFEAQMLASIPGFADAAYIDSQKWAMEFTAEKFRVFELPLDIVVIPSGDPTGLNGVLYRGKDQSESMLYGHENTYATRSGIYLGIVNWQSLYLDRNRIAYPIENIVFSTLACGLPSIDYKAEWMHKLYDIPAIDLWAAPGPAASGTDSRNSVQYTDMLYASRLALYTNMQFPGATGGHSEIHGKFGYLEISVGFPAIEAFSFHIDAAEDDTLTPITIFEMCAAHGTLQMSEAKFDAENDMPLIKYIDSIITFNATEQDIVTPKYTGDIELLQVVSVAQFEDYDKVITNTDVLSWEATYEPDVVPYTDVVANAATFGLGVAQGNTLVVFAQSLFFPEYGCEDGLFVPIRDRTIYETNMLCVDFEAHIEKPILSGYIAAVVDVPAELFQGYFNDPWVCTLGNPDLSLSTGAPKLCGTMAPVPFIYQFEFIADPWRYTEIVALGDAAFDCKHSNSMYIGELLPDIVGISQNINGADIIETHIPYVLTGEFFCKPHHPASAEMMRAPDFVYEPLSLVRVDSHHTLYLNFAEHEDMDFQGCEQSHALVIGSMVVDEPFIQGQYEERTIISMIDISVAEVSCTPNGCWSWGYILDARGAINVIPSPLWYDIVIEYDYENTDPKEMAFIF